MNIFNLIGNTSNDFQFIFNYLERYKTLNIIIDINDEQLIKIKSEKNININFRNIIIDGNVYYLFDGNKKLFAIYHNIMRKTRLLTIGTFKRTMKKCEKEY